MGKTTETDRRVESKCLKKDIGIAQETSEVELSHFQFLFWQI